LITSLHATDGVHATDGEPAVVVDDAVLTIMSVDAEVGAHLEQPSTPRTTSTPSIAESCKERSKPVVGMIFDTLTDVENFYKSYAHEVGFSVHVGQHKKQNEEILFKRYYCSREGYIKEIKQVFCGESGKKEKHQM
jgi:hypothetical protein